MQFLSQRIRQRHAASPRWTAVGRTACLAAMLGSRAICAPAQQPPSAAPSTTTSAASSVANADWEAKAGGPQAFDVISIRPDPNDDDPPSVNVPYGPEDTYTNTGGVFRATNWPVVRLISFAYKTTTGQRDAFRASLPDWADKDGFSIEARSDNQNATKDQMRLMVRSMLAERFHLKVHYESRIVPVFAVELIKPGELGPQLRPHPADDSCSGEHAAVAPRPAAPADGAEAPAPAAPARERSYPVLPGGFPLRCGTYVNMPPTQPYLRHEGGRNLTMTQIVSTFTGMGNLGRPAVDQTGLTGTFDWVMEFLDEREGHTPPPDAEGLHFQQALAKQNGLKLVPSRQPVELLLVDHLEHPSSN